MTSKIWMLERNNGDLIIVGAFSSDENAKKYLDAYNKITRYQYQAKSIREVTVDPVPPNAIRKR